MIRPLPHPVRAVIFDMDGTLTVPALDFAAMRRELGIASRDILEALEEMSEAEQRRAFRIIERHERVAAEQSELSDGSGLLLDFLRKSGVKIGVATRNSQASVDAFSARHGVTFDAIVTRTDAAPKPSPDPLLLALTRAGVTRDEAIYVGDYEFDRLTGEAAGVVTYIVKAHDTVRDDGPDDLRVDSLAQLIPLIRDANGGPAESPT